MYLVFLVSALAVISVASGQSACTTPSGGRGQCVSVNDCDSLQKLMPQDLQLPQSSKCGNQGETVMVCCPAECTTADGKFGKCVSIYSCAHLANRLRPPVTPENRQFLENSKCEGSDAQSVCCGPDTGTTTPTTTRRPANNLNAICTEKQSAYPPDPKSKCCGFDSSIGNRIIVKIVVIIRIAVILGEYDTSHPGKDCVEVDGGGSDCTEGEVVVEIEKLIPRPEYTALSRKNDIGLIKLARNAPFTDFIRPICLPSNDITLNPPPPETFTLYAAGWGITENKTYGTVKLHVGLPYVELNQCQKSYKGPVLRANLEARQMCAGGQPGKDSCRGDSGGPLMYENGRSFEVVGVVNFGPDPCAQDNMPGVYANVYSYLEWIHNTIATNS